MGVFAPDLLVPLLDDGDGVGVGEDTDLFAQGLADFDDIVRVVLQPAFDLNAVKVQLGQVGRRGSIQPISAMLLVRPSS